MVQYNGITLFRDDDGTPSRIDIDLHVHGRELNAFCGHTDWTRRSRATWRVR